MRVIILTSLILALSFLPLTEEQKADSQAKPRCQEIPLGTMIQRIQEIRDVLIKELFFMKQRLEEVFPHSREIAELIWQCRAYPYCSGSCPVEGIEVDIRCAGYPCPPGTHEKIAKEFEEVKKLNDEIQTRAKELKKLIEELESLRKKIREMEESLKKRDPEKEIIIDCFTARRGYVEKEKCLINDYYICKIKAE